MRRIISFILLLSMIVICCSCGAKKAKNEPYSNSFRAFDTMCSYTIYDDLSKKDLEDIRKKIQSTCFDYDYAFDKYTPNSFVKKLNQNKHEIVDGDNLEILKKSIEYSEKTDGAFDITISPLVDLWAINTNHFRVPREAQILKLLPKVGYKQINIKGHTAHLTQLGSIDLGAIAKGFVADKLVKELKDMGVKSAIIDLGGNIYAIGSKEGKPFKVGINKPFGNGELSASVKVKDTSVITSGVYQRYKKQGDKIYSHIIDPKTGRPIDNDLNSVTVISKNATAADALSTGLMVIGLDKGMKLANKTKDIEAIFINKENKLYLTDGLVQKGKEITIK